MLGIAFFLCRLIILTLCPLVTLQALTCYVFLVFFENCLHDRSCSSAYKWKEHDDSFCMSVAAETSESLIQLDTIRDMVIPLLLETPIKGYDFVH